jgi:flagellar motor switch protein FliN/FliY
LVAVNNPTALDLIGEVVAAAAGAVAANLPGSPAPGPAGEGVDGLFLPGGRAVSARLAGAASGSIVVALADPVAAALENGPLGPQDLVAALAPAMADAVDVLMPTFGSPLELEAPYAVAAELALASLEGAIVTVPMHGPDGMTAVFAVAVDIVDDDVDSEPGVDTGAHAMDLPDLDAAPVRAHVGDTDPATLELLADVEMGVTAELGRTRMTVRNLLALAPGSVVELDRVAGSAVDLLVNGTLIARGEVVVIDDEFGVRVTEIVGRTTPAVDRRKR